MADVFISYAREDREFVQRLRDALIAHGREVWVDLESIPPAHPDWQKEVFAGVESANNFVFIISPASLASSMCSIELQHAVENNKRLVAIRYQEVDDQAVPRDLAKPQWLDFRDRAEFDQGIEQLRKAIDIDYEWTEAHSRLLRRAKEWEARQRNSSLVLRGDDLKQAEEWLTKAGSHKEPQPTDLQTQFIIASRRTEARRQRVTLAAVTTGLVISLILATAFFYQSNVAQNESDARATEVVVRTTAEAKAVVEANTRATSQSVAEEQRQLAVQQKTEAERQAALAISGGLAAQSRNFLDTQYDLALLLAAESLKAADSYPARDSLLTVLQYRPRLNAFLHTPAVFLDMAFSPDGNLMAGVFCSQSDVRRNCMLSQVQFWDIVNRRPAGEPFSGLTGPLAFTPDGKALISRNKSGQFVLLDAQTRTLKDLSFSSPPELTNLTISPDGHMLALGGCRQVSFPGGLCTGGQMMIWNLIDGKLLYQTDDANTSYRYSLAFSPDGKILAWSGCDKIQKDEMKVDRCTRGAILIWEVSSGKISKHPIKNEAAAMSVAFNPSGKTLAAGDAKGSIVFFDTTSWQELPMRLNDEARIEGLFYLKDSTTLISASVGKPLILWNTEKSQRIDSISIGSGFFGHAAVILSPTGDTLAVSGCYQYDNTGFICQRGAVLLWNVGDQALLTHAFAKVNNDNWRNDQFISQDGRLMAQTECVKVEKVDELNDKCVAGRIVVVDAATGQNIGQPLEGLPAEIDAATFNQNGDELVAVSCNRREKLMCVQSRIDWWDLETGRPLHPLITYDHWILHIALGPDGKTLFFDGKDNTVERIDLDTGQLVGQPLKGFAVNEMAFSPDGKTMAIGGCVQFFQNCKQSEIRFWNTETWQMASDTISLTAGSTDVSYTDIRALEFSPDGTFMAIATPAGVKLLDMYKHQLVDYTIPEVNINSIAFNRKGNVLAVYGKASSQEGYLSLWDLEKTQLIGKPFRVDFRDRYRFVFSLDDAQLISNGGIAWNVNPLSWFARACQMANRNLTEQEWRTYMDDKLYHKTCQDIP